MNQRERARPSGGREEDWTGGGKKLKEEAAEPVEGRGRREDEEQRKNTVACPGAGEREEIRERDEERETEGAFTTSGLDFFPLLRSRSLPLRFFASAASRGSLCIRKVPQLFHPAPAPFPATRSPPRQVTPLPLVPAG